MKDLIRHILREHTREIGETIKITTPEFIEKAKEELERENVPLRNNPPYNPFDSDDFRGGKRTKNKRTKNKRTKNKRTKNKRSKINHKRKRFTKRNMRRN